MEHNLICLKQLAPIIRLLAQCLITIWATGESFCRELYEGVILEVNQASGSRDILQIKSRKPLLWGRVSSMLQHAGTELPGHCRLQLLTSSASQQP